MGLSEGGAAALLGGDGGDAGAGDGGADAAAAAAAAAAGGDGGAGGGEGAGGGDPEWLGQFSAEGGEGDKPSNRDWLKAKGFKSIDDLVNSYRSAEQGLRDSGRVKVPGEGAKPEEIAAYHKAIGVPEKAEDYAFDLPDGVTLEDLDTDFLTPMREIALKGGAPAAAFKQLAEGVLQHQLDSYNAAVSAENDDRDAKFKEWGTSKDAKMADVQRAMRTLGVTGKEFAAMQRGFQVHLREPGSGRMLDLFQQLGAGMAEDGLIGGGKGKFGVSGEEAQNEIDKLIATPGFDPLNNPVDKARWERLNQAKAAWIDAQQRQQQ